MTADHQGKNVRLGDQAEILRLYIDALLDTSEQAPSPAAPARDETEHPAAVAAPPADWRSQPFQGVMVEGCNCRFVIPFNFLTGIERFPAKLTILPKARPWVLGIHNGRGQQTTVFDLDRLAGRKAKETGLPPVNEDARRDYRYLVLLAEGKWGIACSAVGKTGEIVPARVKWRSEQGTNPWLAGTAKEQLAPVVDVPRLIDYLDGSAAGER